jgi:anti-sigma factor RsiW
MTEGRGFSLGEQHLLPDAVVAFVDGELSPVARERAATHLMRCPVCAAEAAAQRQARSAVRSATVPAVSDGLLASLRAIPERVDLPGGPDELAVTEDGQLVIVQRPDRVAGRMSQRVIGSSAPLGNAPTVLGYRRGSSAGRRAVQGASVVVSGLVLGALALVTPAGPAASNAAPAGEEAPAAEDTTAATALVGPDAASSLGTGGRVLAPEGHSVDVPAPRVAGLPVATHPGRPFAAQHHAAPVDSHLVGTPAALRPLLNETPGAAPAGLSSPSTSGN